MKLVKENYFFFVIIFLLFIVDRIAKNKIIILLENQNNIFINDYLNYNLVFNTGIGFGLLSLDGGFYYNLISCFIFLIILVLIFFMMKSKLKEKYFFSFIIGGALGNLYDRVIFKAVPDFIDFHYQDFHWFSFNIADIFISLGIIFMIINEFVFNKKKNEN
tara:strand:- start:412 stop:894 length:483 start_codon:yes stop_codon:yes gene_type:complete